MIFNVSGMSCAACSARVEKAVRKVDGVTDCAVSLLTNSMTVYGEFKAEDESRTQLSFDFLAAYAILFEE